MLNFVGGNLNFWHPTQYHRNMKELPDLHRRAFVFKNTKRLQRDGGRAWIRDSQLQEMRKGGNGRLVTIRPDRKGDLPALTPGVSRSTLFL